MIGSKFRVKHVLSGKTSDWSKHLGLGPTRLGFAELGLGLGYRVRVRVRVGFRVRDPLGSICPSSGVNISSDPP